MKKHLLLLLVAGAFASCSKKEDPKPVYVMDQSVSLKYDEEHQYVINNGSTDVSASTITWTSSDQTVGAINGSGLFEAKKIGKTTIKAEGPNINLTSEVTVTPYSTLCKEPYIDFNASVSTVKSKETRSLLSETNTGLVYSGENSKVRNIVYTFTNGIMSGSLIMLSNTTSVVEESAKFFGERYDYIGTSSGIYFFSDKSVTIGLGLDSSLGFIAIYMKNTTGLSISSNVKAFRKIATIQSLKNLEQ